MNHAPLIPPSLVIQLSSPLFFTPVEIFFDHPVFVCQRASFCLSALPSFHFTYPAAPGVHRTPKNSSPQAAQPLAGRSFSTINYWLPKITHYPCRRDPALTGRSSAPFFPCRRDPALTSYSSAPFFPCRRDPTFTSYSSAPFFPCRRDPALTGRSSAPFFPCRRDPALTSYSSAPFFPCRCNPSSPST